MSQREPIHGLILDSTSLKAIANIKRKREVERLIPMLITIGVFSNIFTKSNIPTAAISITQTDWRLYAQSMRDEPTIMKQAIQAEALNMIIHYEFNYDRKHLEFWKGIYANCL